MRFTSLQRLLAATLLAGTALAAQPPAGAPPMPTAEILAHVAEAERAYDRLPDMPGTGSFPAVKESVPGLPAHVIYHPADLSRLGATKLGIIAWGNGGCSADGAGARLHLLELASFGYLVIAPGTIRTGPGTPPRPPHPMPKPGQPVTLPPAETHVADLTAGIDWAVAENARPGSPFFGRIDPTMIAVSGHSCGGLQAIKLATTDPRIRAVVIHNSGTFPTVQAFMGVDVDKSALAQLRTPILYILGGPSDIAYKNGMDDYARITGVPAMVANLGDIGHGGSFFQANGAPAALAAAHWFQWQLRGDPASRDWFVGADCRLCRAPWRTERKGFATTAAPGR